MLYEFLTEHRLDIIARSKGRIMASVTPTPTKAELSEGVPVFLAQMENILRRNEGAEPLTAKSSATEHKELDASAAQYGRQLLALGFSMSQVVHSYGAVCQVITGLLDELGVAVSAREYQAFNLCLDDALAAAVTSYEAAHADTIDQKEVAHLGFLAHELRNALHVAVTVTSLIATGEVGYGSRTAGMLEGAHARMRELIDRSLAEVRLRSGVVARRDVVKLFDVFDGIEIMARIDARRKNTEIHVSVDHALTVIADRELLVSAVANLVHNAIKYSREKGHVHLRATLVGKRVEIEVEDECGGIAKEKLDRLFDEYVQTHDDRSGMGLGLSIVRNAITAQGGRIRARSIDGRGCVFTIELPHTLDD
ncbi:MAG: HAMP domain-containing sensor histidine kinase [Polyangia bacterium]